MNTNSHWKIQPETILVGYYHCRVPDTEWSFQDGGLYIVKKVGVKILTIIVLYRLS
jgi:hypothetical protein